MGHVYWIEDEKELLSDFADEMNLKGHTVIDIEDTSGALAAINDMRRAPGPIVVDLFLPAADLDVGHGRVRGHDVGLDLLRRLRHELGTDASLFVVSGNIDLSVREVLIDELGIGDERIFEKPLNAEFEKLVESVHKEADICIAKLPNERES